MAFYRLEEALAKLAEGSDMPEVSRSTYWTREMGTFSVSPTGEIRGSTVLGNLSRRRDPLRLMAHWVLQAPFRYLGRSYGDVASCDQLGRRIAHRQGRQYTGDMQRQTLTLTTIRKVLAQHQPQVLCVIGDGLGVLSSLFLMSFPAGKVISVNLNKALLLDLAAIAKAVPDAGCALVTGAEDMATALNDPCVRSIALQADNAELLSGVPIDVSANVHSMQEMDIDVVTKYFSFLRRCPSSRTLFYCCNKLEKRFHDGTVTRFDAYPWIPADHVLIDEPCPWDTMVYDTRPPFWRRTKSVTWHRLVWLGKEGT